MSTSIQTYWVPRLMGRKPVLILPDEIINYKADMQQNEIPRTYRWYQEILENSASGSEKDYETSLDIYDPTNMLMIFINGLLQRYSIDYTVSGNTLTFKKNVRMGSNIVAIYNYL